MSSFATAVFQNTGLGKKYRSSSVASAVTRELRLSGLRRYLWYQEGLPPGLGCFRRGFLIGFRGERVAMEPVLRPQVPTCKPLSTGGQVGAAQSPPGTN